MYLILFGFSFQIAILILFLISLAIKVILTKNSTKLRKNFYGFILGFIFQSLIVFGMIFALQSNAPKPIEFGSVSTLEEANRKLTELQLYSESVQSNLEFTTQMFYLLIGFMWLMFLVSLASLGFSFIKHLEKTGENDIEKIF